MYLGWVVVKHHVLTCHSSIQDPCQTKPFAPLTRRNWVQLCCRNEVELTFNMNDILTSRTCIRSQGCYRCVDKLILLYCRSDPQRILYKFHVWVVLQWLRHIALGTLWVCANNCYNVIIQAMQCVQGPNGLSVWLGWLGWLGSTLSSSPGRHTFLAENT